MGFPGRGWDGWVVPTYLWIVPQMEEREVVHTCGQRCSKASPHNVPTANATRKVRRNWKISRLSRGTKMMASAEGKLVRVIAKNPQPRPVESIEGDRNKKHNSKTSKLHTVVTLLATLPWDGRTTILSLYRLQWIVSSQESNEGISNYISS